MRLLKLVILGGLGYMLYKMFSDMPPMESMQRGGGRSRGRRGAMDLGSTPQGPQMTGPGVGEPVEAYDPTGASTTHRVGRGVVAR